MMFDELDQLLRSDVFATTPKEEDLKLHDGERREVAILFADIKEFTALSERLDPEQLRMILDKLLKLFTLCIKQYRGYVARYEGDMVMALFGAKAASERDTERAIHAALLMLEKLGQFNTLLTNIPELKWIELGVRIGVNTGLVTTGPIGERREGDFTVYGDAVNLAARMEANAPVNRIMLAAETMQIAKEIFEFEDHGEIEVKGKSEPISVFLVKGLKAKPIPRWQVYKSTYVGRDKEMAMLQKNYDVVVQRLKKAKTPGVCQTPGVLEEKPVVVGIKGEAGLGKSRLLYEFLTGKDLSTFVLHGTTPRIAQNPYCVFTSMIKGYLHISHVDSPQVTKEKLETGFQALETDLNDEDEVQNLRDTLPMVGFLLGLKYYEDVRLQLMGKELQIHLQTAIRYVIEAVAAKANRASVPLLVILEDLHWVDEASRATLEVLMSTLNLEAKRKHKFFKHLVFIFLYRPEYEIPKAVKLDAEFAKIELRPLLISHAEALIQSMLKEIVLPTNIKQQVIEKSEGNPFYLEEWVNLIKDLKGFENLSGLPVPGSLTALILSRIDRLEHDLKLLLQKAAVIGKTFFMEILAEIERRLNRPEDISVQLDSLESADFIWRMLNGKYSAYLFKHIITQEVAYNTLLIANRKILHRIVAEVIENQFAETLEEFYYDLAEHYSKAEIPEKAIEYLEKAGDKAKANHENEKAIALYDRLLSLLNLKGFENLASLRIDTLLKKGDVLKFIGKWKESKHVYTKALRCAEKINDKRRMAESHWVLGIIFLLQGEYEEAMAHYETSLTLFQTVGDQVGISKALVNIGGVYDRKGDYDEAMTWYKKALTMKEALKDRVGISYTLGGMGNVYYSEGDYNAAMACYERQFKICEELEDKLGISYAIGYMGRVHYNKGDFAAAMVCYKKMLEACEELGNKLGISKALYYMGNVYYNQGDFEAATAYYEKMLKICEELGYKPGISDFVGIMGFVHEKQGDYKAAMEYFKQVLHIQEELGDKRRIATSFGNMGVIYHAKGDYDTAIAYLETDLTISEKIGYKKNISLAVNHMGMVYKDKGEYETALMCYDWAIAIGRALGIKPFLCGYLMNKAEVLFLQQHFNEAQALSTEGLQIAEEVSRKETIFQGKVLSAKIDFALGHQEKAVTQLSEMLAQTEDKAEQMDLHYELYQCGIEREEHRKEALRLYRELYAKTPKFVWKKRIEELEIES